MVENNFSFLVMGEHGMCGNGGNGYGKRENSELQTEDLGSIFTSVFDTEGMLKQVNDCDNHYDEIMESAKIGKWARKVSGGDATLYAFTDEQIEDLTLNRRYLKYIIFLLADVINDLAKEKSVEAVPEVNRILRSGDATIVFWEDGTKTIVKKSAEDLDSDYAAFTAALAKKIYGSNSKLSRHINSKTERQDVKKKTAESTEE